MLGNPSHFAILVHLRPGKSRYLPIFPATGPSKDVGRKLLLHLSLPAPCSRLHLSDDPGTRTLSSAVYIDYNAMTIESCIDFCSGDVNKYPDQPDSYIYAGVEYSQECCEFPVPDILS